MFKYIWLKEIKEELYTWKGTAWLLIASLIFSFTSYLLLTNKELSLLDQTELLWLLSKVIIGVALLIVAIDSASIINVEFEKETAESLFLAPITLKDFILGKFSAIFTSWVFVFLISIPYILVTSAGSNLALPFIGYIFLLGSLVILGFIMLIFTISLIYHSSKNTLTSSLIILLAFAIPALFSSTFKNNSLISIFSMINPLDNVFSSLDNVLVDDQTNILQNWQYLLPLLGFCLLTFLFLLFSAKYFKSKGIIKN